MRLWTARFANLRSVWELTAGCRAVRRMGLSCGGRTFSRFFMQIHRWTTQVSQVCRTQGNWRREHTACHLALFYLDTHAWLTAGENLASIVLRFPPDTLGGSVRAKDMRPVGDCRGV